MCSGPLKRRKPGLGTIGIYGEDLRPGETGRRAESTGPFGLDVESMSSRGRVVAGLSMLVPVALSGLFLVAFAPGLWWIFTTYGWIAFPAFGVLLKGLAGEPTAVSVSRRSQPPADKERQLLEVLRARGELTPTRAAMETSLSVAEADKMLRELAEQGHLEVRARGGALYYSLWARPAALEDGT